MLDMRKLMEDYARILPQDHIDTQIYANRETLEELTRQFPAAPDPYPFAGQWMSNTNRLLGLPLHEDESLPDGIIEVRTETKLDRVIRRAARDGRTVNVVKTEPFLASLPPPAPTRPTLCALLRHYWKLLKG